MKILQRNLYPILLVLFLVWMAIGVFPLYCYENDSMHVLTSCGIVVNQGIQFPPMLHYEYDMQPLTYFVVVIVAKIASFLTVEHVYCLLAWISAVAFTLGSLDFVNKVYRPHNKLHLLLALALLPEMYAAGMYPNSAIPAAASFVWALCFIWDRKYIPGLLLMVIAPLFRVDVVIVYPALLPLFWLRGESFKKSFLFSAAFALSIIALLTLCFWLLHANPLKSIGGYQSWSAIVSRHEVILAILGYYSIVYLILLPLGVVFAVRNQVFKHLFLCLLPICLLHFVYRSMGCASKHYLYISPFVILLGTIAIEGISRRSRLVKSVALVALIFVSCFSVARINRQDLSLNYRLPVRYAFKEIHRGDFTWSFGLGTGQHVVTRDEHMLATGNLLYPFYIHYFKKEMLQQMEAQLDYLQAQRGGCTLYAADNYTDNLALPLYFIEKGYTISNATWSSETTTGIETYDLHKDARRVHVVLVHVAEHIVITPDMLRSIFIENKQSHTPVYITAGTYETAALYNQMAKTNPQLKKVATGLYQLVLDEH